MSRLMPPIGPGDHVLGELTAPVTLVEYGDYQCPFCGRAYLSTKIVRSRLGNDLCFAFRHFPLTQAHPHALSAALAAEAAGAQGDFWNMHATLFENQDALEYDDLLTYATQLGLDIAGFERDLDDPVYLAKVRNDFRSGVRSGVNGTPTFFINGVRFDESWDPDTLTGALREAMSGRELTSPAR